jgi:hypothetical protein
VLDATGFFPLSAPIVIPAGESLTLRGDGDHPRQSYFIDRGNGGRILDLAPGSSATVEHLVLWRGYMFRASGGAVRAVEADLVLRDVTLQTSVAEHGAGLFWDAAAAAPGHRLVAEDVASWTTTPPATASSRAWGVVPSSAAEAPARSACSASPSTSTSRAPWTSTAEPAPA